MLSSRQGGAGVPIRVFGGKTGGVIAVLGGAILIGAGFKFGGQVLDWVALKVSDGKSSSLLGTTLSEEEKVTQKLEEQNIVINAGESRAGVSATLNVDFYDVEPASEVQVYDPKYWAFNSAGTKIINAANDTSFSSTKGEVVTIRVGDTTTGSNVWYGEPYELLDINTEAPTYRFNVHKAAVETSLTVKIYDTDNNELTAAGTGTTADYNYSIGVDADKKLYVKLTNEDPDSLFRLGAACTFENGDADDYKITDSRFVSAEKIPKQLKDAALSLNFTSSGATNASFTAFDLCYVPKKTETNPNGYFDMHEWDEIKLDTVIEASLTEPTGATGDIVGIAFFDTSYEDGKDGKIYLNWYKLDDNERVTDVGIGESHNSPQGKQSGAMIDLQ